MTLKRGKPDEFPGRVEGEDLVAARPGVERVRKLRHGGEFVGEAQPHVIVRETLGQAERVLRGLHFDGRQRMALRLRLDDPDALSVGAEEILREGALSRRDEPSGFIALGLFPVTKWRSGGLQYRRVAAARR